ncbi:hypothetical protein [Planomonospora sp. ID82291]|uniref:hypothetical protein n=1 Tax=Planomonospora sp. ID82291 TaxID=2738136 RepID=UPI0018C35AA1|nr:hypothetical protein [Planomonospora sp. ID82291]MBG0819032.1 hypothetical protein [Planomonospora sp. ID82291]
MSDDYLGDIGPDPRADGSDETMTALVVLGTELGEARAALAELGDRLDKFGERANHLNNRVETLTALSEEVRALSANVAKLLEKPAKEEAPSLVVDLAHIPKENLPNALAELLSWVRDVLFAGWPHAQTFLGACWPHHPEIVNAMLWLRAAYHAAYDAEDTSPHRAADFYFWLRDILKWAEERTRCPEDRPHRLLPERRDDGDVLAEALRRPILAEVYQAMQLGNDPDASPEDVQAARERVSRLSQEHGITREEYAEYAALRKGTPRSY